MMNRRVRMVLALLVSSSAAVPAVAQSWSAADARRTHNFVEYGVPDVGDVPNAYYVNATAALPPNVYARRATPGGLIETAARRLNPFAAPSRAGGITFAPAPYRQPLPASAYRVMRPVSGPTGYRSEESHAGRSVVSPAPSGARIPGVNCPTCPR
ncbi:hypothetical protein [Tautonia sociabilis]|uniref:Uncharacterized protein n=1 Tax=Tautonia sociabilis TaxID=2080755 RepID=A0A432MCB5_9BACT|nr:hypothetical protein [Tautonia sociabilis]RUL81755.1 hypothetical protein TsocGM_24650 [Tautonia sociabilis]